jgi:hypothetical protein
MAAKVRPCLVISAPIGDLDRAIVTLVPRTTSTRGTRFEAVVWSAATAGSRRFHVCRGRNVAAPRARSQSGDCGHRTPNRWLESPYGNNPRVVLASATLPTARMFAPVRMSTLYFWAVS